MSTRNGKARTDWTRRFLVLILAPLSLLASLGLTVGVASAQQANGNGGGGGKMASAVRVAWACRGVIGGSGFGADRVIVR